SENAPEEPQEIVEPAGRRRILGQLERSELDLRIRAKRLPVSGEAVGRGGRDVVPRSRRHAVLVACRGAGRKAGLPAVAIAPCCGHGNLRARSAGSLARSRRLRRRCRRTPSSLRVIARQTWPRPLGTPRRTPLRAGPGSRARP